jgi:hypothetical protein
MEWKEEPSKENQGLGEAKNGAEERRDPMENQNDSVSVENNKSRREEDETCENFKKVSKEEEMIFCGQPPVKYSQGREGGENETGD